MTVELLYLPGCPNHEKATGLIRAVLQAEGVSAELIEIPVRDSDEARVHGFPGSPTLRVNGRDIEEVPADQLPVGFACRAYFVNGKPQGLPPRGWLERAVREAHNSKEKRQ